MIPITKDLNAEVVVIEDPEKTEGNLNKSVQKAIKKPLIFKPHSPFLLQASVIISQELIPYPTFY